LSNYPPESAVELKARALRHLARREHSRAELERKLAPHAESAGQLQALLDQLEEKKQLSNERFAEQRAHVLARKFGPARIRHDLQAKGISPELIECVSSAGELERARAILQRKYGDPAASREERARRARFLQGRGFSSDVIHRLVMRNPPED
jgi:regulatory protein